MEAKKKAEQRKSRRGSMRRHCENLPNADRHTLCPKSLHICYVMRCIHPPPFKCVDLSTIQCPERFHKGTKKVVSMLWTENWIKEWGCYLSSKLDNTFTKNNVRKLARSVDEIDVAVQVVRITTLQFEIFL